MIEDKFTLISFDVVSFTNVPIELAIKNLENRWEFQCNILKEEFMGTIQFVLELIYFTFDNIYK